MKHLLQVMVILVFLITSACSTLDNGAREKNMTLTRLGSLSIGRTTKGEVRSLFGEGPMQLGSEKERRLVWLYFLKPPGYQRLNLAFDSQSGVLESMAW